MTEAELVATMNASDADYAAGAFVSGEAVERRIEAALDRYEAEHRGDSNCHDDMKALKSFPQNDLDPLEAECPPEVTEEFRRRLASLDRGEGLTTKQLRQRRQAAREHQALTPLPR